jgi:hypothetical protein
MDESELRQDGDPEEETPEDVAVLDDASAVMLLDRIREANRQYERMEAWYEFQKGKARTIRDNTVAWAERCLRAYFDMVPTRDTKTQRSYELPGGKLLLKHQDPEYKRDEAQLVKWLKAEKRPELIKVEESAKWGELKKMLQVGPDGKSMITADGEVVPGVTVMPREDKFSVTLK